MTIPLTHHKNSGYTELTVFGVYLSPAAGGGRNVKNIKYVSSVRVSRKQLRACFQRKYDRCRLLP
ncbi:hypothetical protein [uncultured Ruminococcus sp.]|uniref:hypothetical protein n=1 Tax=uncultured Ruminococcus sp. TaxID=165186 RepID=UPI0025D93235|nr:hypothetical protein [uncultured Ruminococcus sp.]